MLRKLNLPFPLDLLARMLGFLGSAAFATVIIAAGATVLGWATWLESRWGTAAVQFGVYRSTWFALLVGLLGLNVLSAALVRFPWRKKQTGFLLVHAGILLLLVGCWLTRQGGVDGQMSLLEGDGSSTVLEPDMHFELAVVSGRADGDASGHDGVAEIFEIPFRPGPFNWDDYGDLARFPWALVGRDRGVLFDRDGVKLETLDYYSDSRRVDVPELKLRAAYGPSRHRSDGGDWEAVKLAIRSLGDRSSATHGATAVGDWRELSHGEIVLFGMAEDKAETEAFLDSGPVGPLGGWGQIVIHAGGQKFHFLLEDLLDGKPAALGNSGRAVELVEFDRERLQVALSIVEEEKTDDGEAKSPGKKRVGMLVLHGLQANLDRQDGKNGFFGVYWFDPAKVVDMKGMKNADESTSRPVWIAARRPRLDILQGHDQKLYYRAWRPSQPVSTGELPSDGSAIAVFAPGVGKEKADDLIPLTVYVESFMPSLRPGMEVRPLAFNKDGEKRPRVKLRLSVGGASREFWLAAAADDDDERRQSVSEDKDVPSAAAVQLLSDTVELGFRVVLKDFQRRLDPGTSRPSGYSSRMDFVERDKNDGTVAKILEKDVVVSLNSPADFTDPSDGRNYRFFQSAFSGPYRADDLPIDETRDGADSMQEEIYRSTFAVSSDPGRQLKYAGCLMIVAGIVVMYYMKAYFFRKRK